MYRYFAVSAKMNTRDSKIVLQKIKAESRISSAPSCKNSLFNSKGQTDDGRWS